MILHWNAVSKEDDHKLFETIYTKYEDDIFRKIYKKHLFTPSHCYNTFLLSSVISIFYYTYYYRRKTGLIWTKF